MKNTQHVQCKLRKGASEMVAWIPKSIAIKDRIVDLDDPEQGEAKRLDSGRGGIVFSAVERSGGEKP